MMTKKPLARTPARDAFHADWARRIGAAMVDAAWTRGQALRYLGQQAMTDGPNGKTMRRAIAAYNQRRAVLG